MSSHPAIRVSGLSKLYRVGARQQGYKTLRESIADACWAPLKRLQQRSAAKVQKSDESSARLSGENFWALKDVSFDVQPGEVVGIIGRNGAGKSTLLKILSRITEPTSGRIELRGRVGSLLEVGTGFHPELTGRENIYMNGSILGMSRREIQGKFDEIVDFSGIEDFLDTPVKRYSSGMYVRLAFAVAAHLEPEILIVDEVLAVGDAEFQKKCLGKMQDVASHGRTVLFVSHNMPAVQGLCTRAILLQDGRVIDNSTPKEAIRRYITLSLESSGPSCDSAIVDLSSRHNSYDKGVLHILAASLHDSEGRPTTRFEPSRPFQIRIELQSLDVIPSAQVGIIIKSHADQWLAMTNTGMLSPTTKEISDRQVAILNIPKLPFVPGRYFVDVSIAIRSSGRIDYVDRAIAFDVAPYDIFGTGYTVTDRDGIVYIDGEWKLLGSSS